MKSEIISCKQECENVFKVGDLITPRSLLDENKFVYLVTQIPYRGDDIPCFKLVLIYQLLGKCYGTSYSNSNLTNYKLFKGELKLTQE
jgi:hypothetical protein